MRCMDRAVKYLRVSTIEQDEENQRRAIEEFIKEKGWKDVGEYIDHGKSAYKDDAKRKDYQRMLTDAKQRQFEHIVCFNLDRFSRQDENEVLDLIKNLRLIYNVEVNAVYGDEWKQLIDAINNIPNMGFIAKAMTEMIETVIRGLQAKQARRESEKISERVLESKKFQKAKKEKRIGRPKIPDKVITKIQELLKEGKTYKEIKAKVRYQDIKGKWKTPSEPFVSLVRKELKEKGKL